MKLQIMLSSHEEEYVANRDKGVQFHVKGNEYIFTIQNEVYTIQSKERSVKDWICPPFVKNAPGNRIYCRWWIE